MSATPLFSRESAPSPADLAAVAASMGALFDSTSTPPEPLSEEPPSLVDHDAPVDPVVDERFEVQRVIARGRLSTIYAATERESGAELAIKVLKPGPYEDDLINSRVLRDARLVGAAGDDHVACVIDAGLTSHGAPWIATDLLDGVTLAQRMASQRRMPRGEVWRVLLQVAHGLEGLHRAGVVHRDLRPSNVFLLRLPQSATRVKLVDVGVSHRVEWDRARGAVDAGSEWIAPECAPGSKVTAPADFWSFGLLAYWLFTGHAYWPSDLSSLEAPIVSASQRAAEQDVERRLPPGFDDWFERCVARAPRARFQSAAELSLALTKMFREAPEQDDDDEPAADAQSDTPSDHAPPTQEPVDEREVPLPQAHDEGPAVLAIAPVAVGEMTSVRTSAPPHRDDEPDASLDTEQPEHDSADVERVSSAASASEEVDDAPSQSSDGAAEWPNAGSLTDIFANEPVASNTPAKPTLASSEPPVRYAVPLVETRQAPVAPQRPRALWIAAAFFGSAALIALVWGVAFRSPPPPARTRVPDRVEAPSVQPPAPITHAEADGDAPAPDAIEHAASSATAAPVSAPSEAGADLSLRGWPEGAIRAWTGELRVRGSRSSFALALRRRSRFSVAGFFTWDVRDTSEPTAVAQVRENLRGAFDPSSGLVRLRGTSSSDPMRMPVGAYALHFGPDGAFTGTAMLRGAVLEGTIDLAAAARVPAFLIPEGRSSGRGAASGAARRTRP